MLSVKAMTSLKKLKVVKMSHRKRNRLIRAGTVMKMSPVAKSKAKNCQKKRGLNCSTRQLTMLRSS